MTNFVQPKVGDGTVYMKQISPEIAELLNMEAERINSPSFINADPVQFPRKFTDVRDIELAAFLSAMLAWGNRKMICRDIERLMTMMDWAPYAFVKEGAYEMIAPEKNIHRTTFARDIQHFLRGMRSIYAKYGTLNDFANSMRIGESDTPSWMLAEQIQHVMTAENKGVTCSRCLPLDFSKTALKRVNMALRWLVRDDGIVDMGIWDCIPKSKLFIPLDVHVGNVSRELGLLERKGNDRKSVLLLTETLRQLNPSDPCIYDYALFGIGVESKGNKL